MKKLVLVLIVVFLASICFAEKIAEFPDVVKPERVLIDGDNLVIGLQYSVQVYSLKDFKLKTEFGKKGEGPGELRDTPLVFALPDSYLLFAWGKLVWFSKNGELLKEMKVSTGFHEVRPLKENFIAAQMFHDTKNDVFSQKYYLLNSKAEIIKEVYHNPNRDACSSDDHGVFKKFIMVHHYLYVCGYDDKIFIADTKKGFFIDVYGYKGNHLYSINKNIEKIKIGEDFKKKIIADLRKTAIGNRVWPRIKNVLTFHEYFPAIRSFLVLDGKIYVTTYKEKDDKHELIVLDLKGNILKKVFLSLKSWRIWQSNTRQVDLFTVKDGKLYELIDNEAKELYELHVTDLNKGV